MFIDKAGITIKAGNGGGGAISFHREKFVQNGGPDGGDGGRGGSVYFEVDPHMNNLINFHYTKKYVAESGEKGGKRNCYGKKGEDIVIKVPKGTIIRDLETDRIIADMYYDNEKKLVLSGGLGGKGNAHFATSTRQSPSFSQTGEIVEAKKVVLELKTIADVGLVGLPNVGKSTLLSVITSAKPKIANYHFTTLTPNLGVVKYYENSFVVADIPGLIEGASEGAGLGHEFLKHIERTRMLIHVVDMSGVEGYDSFDVYNQINHELKQYSETLADKIQIVAANKMDSFEAEEHFNEFIKKMPKNVKVIKISALTKNGLDQLLKEVFNVLKDLPLPEPLQFTPFEYEKEDYKNYSIRRNDAGDFIVEGPYVQHLSRNVVLDDIDSFSYFQRALREGGVIKKLRENGCVDGNVVIFGDIEFEFVE